MTRLPITFLLYVAILGLLGASGWQFYQAAVVERQPKELAQKRQEQERERFLQILADGANSAGKVAVGPNYAEPAAFWDAFKDANFNGEEPPPPPEPANQTEVEQPPAEAPQTPLEEIFVLTCVVGNGAESRIVIRYKPGANVEIPASELPPAPAGANVAAAAVGRQPMGNPTFPNHTGELGHPHHLELEDTLWKPYDHIRFVRVGESHAVFVREDPSKPKEEWKEESIYPEVLALPQDVLSKLAEGLGIERRPGDAAAVEEPMAPAQSSGWVEQAETSEIAPGRFNIGTRDSELFARNGQRVFNEDIGTADWTSSTGSLRGVRITKLAPGYDRFGVAENDILIELNGEPVRTKAEAIRIGKDLYKRGVRQFDGVFLTPTGRRYNRTYVAPDQE